MRQELEWIRCQRLRTATRAQPCPRPREPSQCMICSAVRDGVVFYILTLSSVLLLTVTTGYWLNSAHSRSHPLLHLNYSSLPDQKITANPHWQYRLSGIAYFDRALRRRMLTASVHSELRASARIPVMLNWIEYLSILECELSIFHSFACEHSSLPSQICQIQSSPPFTLHCLVKHWLSTRLISGPQMSVSISLSCHWDPLQFLSCLKGDSYVTG